jgi:hypothetical protein
VTHPTSRLAAALVSFVRAWSISTWVFVLWTIAIIVANQVIALTVANVCADASDVAYCERGETNAYAFSAVGLFYGAWFIYAVAWLLTSLPALMKRLQRRQ